MDFHYEDFNNADHVFAGAAAEEWAELEEMLKLLPLFLQPSDQAGRVGQPIFDPKATNARLTQMAEDRGWSAISVPPDLKMFGKDWDGGKGAILAEWQFSNYPFLWNNVIRSEAVFKSRLLLDGLQPIDALVIVTKSGILPASNSTLYYEQACAQLGAVTKYDTFEIPIRMVGLTLPAGDATTAIWTAYPGRYARHDGEATEKQFRMTRGRASQYEVQPVRFTDM